MTFAGSDLLRKATDAGSRRGEQFYSIDTEGFEMPSQLSLGLAYKSVLSDKFTTVISTAFQNNNFANDQYQLGAEINYNEMLFLRGGYALSKDRSGLNGDDNIFGPAFGAGFKFGGDLDITVDYAYRTVDFFDPNQIFEIKIGF